MKTQTELYGLDRDLVAFLRSELAGQTEKQIQRYLQTIREIYSGIDELEAEHEEQRAADRVAAEAKARDCRGRTGKPRYRRE